MNSISRLYQKSPYIYFTIVWFGVAFPGIFSGHLVSTILFFFCLPFIYQVFKEKKGLNLLLGVLMLLCSIFMGLAYLSDAVKIKDPGAPRAMEFLIGGGLFTILNFLMSVSLIIKASKGNSLREQRAVAPLAA
jgi:hypothetical protein